jgi:hypothetical protein
MAITGKLPTKTDENNVFKIFTVKRTVDSDGTIHNKLEVDLENEIILPTGPDKLLLDKTISDIIATGRLNIANDVPAITGFATDVNMRVIANTTEYTQSNLVANVLTITSSKGIQLKNDGSADFTITIGSFTYTIKAGEVRCIELINAFTSVTFGANAVFRAFGITRSA